MDRGLDGDDGNVYLTGLGEQQLGAAPGSGSLGPGAPDAGGEDVEHDEDDMPRVDEAGGGFSDAREDFFPGDDQDLSKMILEGPSVLKTLA